MIERWLGLLCQLLPGVVRAVVVRRDGSVWAQWPAQTHETIDSQRDAETLRAFCAADPKLNEVRYREMNRPGAAAGLTQVAMPLQNGALRVGTVALELPLKPEQRATTELLLRWSQAWLEALSETGRESQRGPERILQVLEQSGRFDALAESASSLATALVHQYGFAQVLICLRWRGRVRVTGISNAPSFDRRSEMFALLEKDLSRLSAGAEALPEQSEYQRWLATHQPPLHALVQNMGEVGYCVFLHAPGKAPASNTRAQCRQILRLLAPFYRSQIRLQQGTWWAWQGRVLSQYRDTKARKKWLWSGAVTLLVLLLLCLPGQHRVTARASLEGKIQRAIVAPEEGYLLEASAKAGEMIRQGQVLAQLDNKSIQLEIQRWLGEKQEYERQYNRELTALNPVEMRIAKAKIAQADAQLNLYRERLQRVRITSPIDGVIIKGDLSRAVGSPVQRGQVLYEIAPLDAYKLVIQVPQQSIRHVQTGQTGQLRLASLPHAAIAFQVTSVASVYSEQETDIVYRVEAEIDAQQLPQLRPGMSGYAKIETGKRPYGWLMTHPLLEWLVMKLWRL